jgi:glutamate--cysteine ligase
MKLFDFDLFSLFSDTRRAHLLTQGTWGLEREALRMTPAGELALTPHPAEFGDKETNPRITTDFSESQIELITPPCKSIKAMYRELENLHQEVRNGLAEEWLWPLSMPGKLPDDQMIPIALYTSDAKGKEHEIYRKGLALRYGKKMQMISGIHYNYSFSPELLRFLYSHSQHTLYPGREESQKYADFVNALYFSVVRNFLRYRWLLLYFLGASPRFDDTYEHEMLCRMEAARECGLASDHIISGSFRNAYGFLEATHGFPEATSLRMSRAGYYTPMQQKFWVSYNSQREYVRDLRTILTTRSEQYSQLGLCQNGKMVQLNDFILQKESEFYSPIRFKQPPLDDETPLEALDKRGVRYLEMRMLDLDPSNPNGVDLNTLYFTHTLMIYALLSRSPAIDRKEMKELHNNHHLVALAGRKKGLRLTWKGKRRTLIEWAREIVHELRGVAALLDRGAQSGDYTRSVHLQSQKLNNPALLPSAIIEKEMQSAGHDMTSYGLTKAGKLHWKNYGVAN